MKMLKPGDPCPCCGKPIKTKDPERLALMTRYAEAKALVTAMEELYGKENTRTS